MNDKFLIPTSIVIAGLLIGGGLYLKGRISGGQSSNAGVSERNSAGQNSLASEDLAGILEEINANDHVLGSVNSRVIVVEYSDPECPFCKDFHTSMLRLMQEYGKDQKLAWVYRHFPIADIHSKAPKEAEAQECAAVQGGDSKFWEFTNKLYEVTPSNNQLDPSELTKIAVQVGLSSQKFEACLESGEFSARVNADVINAQELGALGTPYSVLIDTKTNQYYPLEGAYPYDQLKSVIDLILAS